MNETPTQPKPNQFALKTKEDAPKDILTLLRSDSMKKQVALALPKHMSPDRMMRVMLTTVSANPKLKECSQTSLLAALMKCSQYGLEPDGRHAHLIPFAKECQLIFDYKGLVALVRRSGEVKTIHCDVVYEGDEFSYCYGTGAHLRHKPTLESKKRGDITCAYSFVVMASGEESFEVMPLDEVLDIRDNSQGYKAFVGKYTKSNPWDSNFAEMAKKSVFRRHTKWLPLSFELKDAVAVDDDDARFAAAKAVRATDLTPAPTALPEPASRVPQDEVPMDYAPTETASADPAPEPEPEPKKPAAAKPKKETPPPNPVEALKALITTNGYGEGEVIEVCVKRFNAQGVKEVSEWPADYIAEVVANWASIKLEVKTHRLLNA